MTSPRRSPSRPARSGRASRPATARARPATRSAGRAQPARESGRRPRYTNRMAVLLVVIAVLVVSYASSMRAYLQQRSDIDALQARIASSRAHIHDLKKEKRRWHDKAYVEQQARARFGWVLPGETAYQVIGADGKPLPGARELPDPTDPKSGPPEPWWSRAYGSLERADHPEKYVRTKPSPAKRIVPDRDQRGAGR